MFHARRHDVTDWCGFSNVAAGLRVSVCGPRFVGLASIAQPKKRQEFATPHTNAEKPPGTKDGLYEDLMKPISGLVAGTGFEPVTFRL